MSFAKSNLQPDTKKHLPKTRIAKLALIRETFAEQGKLGWDACEQNQYLISIGLEPTRPNKARSDEEIDFILADMIRHRLILIKD